MIFGWTPDPLSLLAGIALLLSLQFGVGFVISLLRHPLTIPASGTDVPSSVALASGLARLRAGEPCAVCGEPLKVKFGVTGHDPASGDRFGFYHECTGPGQHRLEEPGEEVAEA